MQGKIIKGIAGFYYVHAVSAGGGAGIYECKARGVFRKDNHRPLVGDNVEMDVLDGEEGSGTIRELLPRRSELLRPAVANVDQALVIFSIISPKPNFNLLDRFLVVMGHQDIPCIVCFNKQDLDKEGEGTRYRETYAGCGCEILTVSAREGTGIEELKSLLSGRTTVVAGPSGAGKSSIVNCLQSKTHMETGRISEKIQRGRHTTRHTELIAVGEGTYILDTPGFSSLDLFEVEKGDLSVYYPEFSKYEKYCRFGGCAHIHEPVCGVRDAVVQGGISKLRYDNYCLLYEELKDKKKW